jgi:hypothetical protein
MYRIVCLLPSRRMALRVSAIGRGDRQSVIIIDVARCASEVGMAVGQQESRSTVIECGCSP